ncbi:MAG: hypothetical protein KUG81_05440, partial [Gammaproteobacteria bacterium]|nr:hypothetical protein [Gammaproteobacteria bacterium]
MNRIRKAGKLNNTLFVLFMLIGTLVSGAVFVFGFLIGGELLHESESLHIQYVWTGLALGFLFFWTIGLISELQQSNGMSLQNLLHLPVSLRWVFLYNYASSLVSLSAALFLPAMLGLALATFTVNVGSGIAALCLVFGFFGMVSALTYQLRSWLARLMQNKRRGRNIITVITVVFIGLAQMPNLIHIMSMRASADLDEIEVEELVGTEKTEASLLPGLSSVNTTIDGDAEELLSANSPTAPATEETRRERRQRRREARRVKATQMEELFENSVVITSRVLPIGWLSTGARASLDGQWIVASLCILGMLAIMSMSLRRSYRMSLAGIVAEPTENERRAVEGLLSTEAPPTKNQQ